MRETGANLGIPVYVFGPETHMTAVVGMALGKRPIPCESVVEFSTANFLLPGGQEDVSAHEGCFVSSHHNNNFLGNNPTVGHSQEIRFARFG